MTLPHYIPLTHASQRSRLSVQHLKRLVAKHIIKAVEVNGEIAIDERSIMRKEDLPEYKKFSKLRGSTLGIAEAARKYGASTATIHRWVQKGFIKSIGKEGAQKILICEQEVAYCVEIYKQAGSRKGRRLFNDDGTPYELKHPDRATEQ